MRNDGGEPVRSAQFARVESCRPAQRGHVRFGNSQALNAALDVGECGYRYRGLGKRLGSWHTLHTLHTGMHRGFEAAVLDRAPTTRQALGAAIEVQGQSIEQCTAAR